MKDFFASKQMLRRVFYFFPFQLLFLHLKTNHLLLIFWAIFYGIVSRTVALKYGIPYLFLDPEYMGRVDFWSYIILGFSCGGFIMAFNISSYIINAFRFPFLATLSRPFVKYAMNNTIIPVVFVLFYIYNIYMFQTESEFLDASEVLIDIAGFILGIILNVFISLGYFLSTNKDIFKMFGMDVGKQPAKKDNPVSAAKGIFHRQIEWGSPDGRTREWHVETYLGTSLQLRLARGSQHYDNEMLMQVFKQNHMNAAFFEVLVILSLLVFGLFRETDLFAIPAGASVFLLCSMLLMLSSALYSWLRGWVTTLFIFMLLLVNFFSKYDLLNYRNKAYGMDYDTIPAQYDYEHMQPPLIGSKQYEADVSHTLDILNNWRQKNSVNSNQRHQKPKLVMINASGGGIRSFLWTLYSMQYADSVLGGQLLEHTMFITGSSGGMIGAAYLRELQLREKLGIIPSIYNKKYATNASRDLLNPVALTIAVNDLFLRLQTFKDGENEYIKDRGYAFERQLNINTDYMLNKRLRDYKAAEDESLIPMLILTPSISNDGRRMFISPQPMSYLINQQPSSNFRSDPMPEGIEFSRFFEAQNAGNLQFTTALRMSATFPYIMPTVTLPSEPIVEVIDAGLRDNFGVKTSIKLMHTFKDWINTNTSGIVLIQIRDSHKKFPIEKNPLRTILQSFISPVGSVYENLFHVQDYNHDALYEYTSTWFEGQVDVIDLQMRNEGKAKISLSWHLTTREKRRVMESIMLPENQEAIQKLRELLE